MLLTELTYLTQKGYSVEFSEDPSVPHHQPSLRCSIRNESGGSNGWGYTPAEALGAAMEKLKYVSGVDQIELSK